jgi:hypothetical protein
MLEIAPMRTAWTLASLTAIAATVYSGCSSDSASPSVPVADAGADVDVSDAAPDDAAADTGASYDQDPNKYPATHSPLPQLVNHGGSILDKPRIVTVSFTGDASRDKYRAFDDAIVKGAWWTQVMTGFGVSAGTGGIYAELPNTLPTATPFSDDDIQALIKAKVKDLTLPAPDKETLYVMYFPPGITLTKTNGDGCKVWGGYHKDVAVEAPGDAGVVDVAYAVIPHCQFPTDVTKNFVQTTVTASHELAEAASDPLVTIQPAFNLDSNDAWVPSYYAGGYPENGDLCGEVADFFVEGGYSVQRIWSNSAAAIDDNPCAPAPLGRVYFAAAPRTKPQLISGRKVDGYVIVPRGATLDVVVDVFSKAALPHDLKLMTGVNDPQFTNGNIIGKIANGITATLSKTTAHNGNGVVMTITVPANATVGDTRFQVRALLETGDYNDWPLIVHVK